MNLLPAAAQGAVNSNLHSPTSTRLQGRWLTLLRLGWVVLSIITLSIFIASLPVYFVSLRTAYAVGFAVLIFSLGIFVAIVWFIVAVVIFWRKSNDWMALLVSLMLMAQGATSTINPLKTMPSVWQFLAVILSLLAFFLLVLVFSLFPSGRFVPRWIGWLALMYLGWEVVVIVLDFLHLLPVNYGFLFDLIQNALLGSFVVSQIYRYHSISGRAERQQTKWIVYGVTVTYLIELVITLFFDFFASSFQASSLAVLILIPISNVAPILIPLSFGFAILRYRLWDIDIIINRTLVYGTLTALLAGVYFGSVIGLQSLLHGFTGGNQLAIVGSTLLIAALFQPLRHRIQNIIDRRFYRRKYDTTRTLAAFSVVLRNEVDLNRLSEQLVEVVQETMQPTHVSLWLRPPNQELEPTNYIASRLTEQMGTEKGEA